MKLLSNLTIAIILLLTILSSSLSFAKVNSCQKTEQLCKETIQAADQVIFEEMRKNSLLSQQLTIEIEENKNLKSILVEASNPPWYLQRTTIFLIGIITGGILNEKL
jgi:hypothetical protein